MCLPGWRAPSTRNLSEENTAENLELWQRERRGPMASLGLRRCPSSARPPSGRSEPRAGRRDERPGRAERFSGIVGSECRFAGGHFVAGVRAGQRPVPDDEQG
jgi:hypothetical protein